jgi:DNA-binding response OmpR family regulator
MTVGLPGRRRRSEPLTARRAPAPPDDVLVDVRVAEPPIDLTASPTATVGPRRRILLVDDEPDVRGWLRIALEPLRWDVNAARNASEAVEMAVRLLPDVVLLDQRLPDGTGIEVGRWLRQNQPAMQLVMFSAFLDLRTEEEAAELGITTISKVDHKALFATLAAIREDIDARTARRASAGDA